jgi:multicomponent Na+:H+ antiporter subunit B
MTPAARRALALAGLAVLGLLAAWAVTGLPDFGHPRGPYATEAVKLSLQERHVTNTVAGVTFDVRGIDTLGEELILFCAAVGSMLLLRGHRAEGRAEEAVADAEAARPQLPGSLRALGALLVGPVLVLGVYVVAHGHLTPGGGFQGGVILAAALLLVYAAGQMIGLERVRPVELVEVVEAVGAAAYALVAIGGLVFAAAAMENFLPLGTQGSLLSGGTIPVLNVAVGVEVAGAVTLILTEFLDQALLRQIGGDEA